MKPKGLVKNTSALLAIQFTNQLLPLVNVPHLTRALGVNAYGAYAFAIAVTLAALVVTDFGFNLWATAEVSVHRDDRTVVNRLFGAITGAKIILTAICLIAIFAYTELSDKPHEYAVALYWTALPILGLTLQPIWLFNGLEQMTYITVFVLTARIMFTASVFVLIRSPADLHLLVAAYGVSQLVAAMLSMWILSRHGHIPTPPSLRTCLHVLRKAAPFFASRVAVSTYTVGGALFLGTVSTTRSVATYAVAEQLYRGAQALLSPVGQVMYPYMMRTGNFRVLMRATALVTGAAITGAVVGAYLGPQIVQLLFGPEFGDTLPVVHIFLVAIIANAPSIMLGYPMLGALGEVRLANRSVLAAGTLQVILLLGCYLLGLTSAVAVACTVLAAELTVFVLRATWSVTAWRKRAKS